jgi:hypothetical protein
MQSDDSDINFEYFIELDDSFFFHYFIGILSPNSVHMKNGRCHVNLLGG